MKLVLRVAALALASPCFDTAAIAAPALSVETGDGLVSTPYSVRISGVRPNAKVVVSARFLDGQAIPQRWTAIGTYRADRRGAVDSATMASSDGTYTGVVAGGLACSALPVPKAEIGAYVAGLPKTGARLTPALGNLDAYNVEVSATVDGKALAPVTIERRYRADGVQVTEVAEGRVNGLYFEPAGPVRGTPVVLIGGSGGGLSRGHAALLASRGYPVLSLAYFSYKDLPKALLNIPVETFADGAAWLARKTGTSRVVLFGISRGSEAVQLTAGYFPEHVSGIIAAVPSPLIHAAIGPGTTLSQPAWTVGGQAVPAVVSPPGTEDRLYHSPEASAPPGYVGTPDFLPNWESPAAYFFYATPLERINVPILAFGGDADTMWPSGFGARKIKERMTALGKDDLVEVHTYPRGGHGIVSSFNANAISGFSFHNQMKIWVSSGGDPEANCQASFDNWNVVLRFLDRIGAPAGR